MQSAGNGADGLGGAHEFRRRLAVVDDAGRQEKRGEKIFRLKARIEGDIDGARVFSDLENNCLLYTS
ncbi:MAG: hypothetical protein MPK62_08700, partial [Alphaproteobacteria bacterium]|nr:hypothetical protein [Alphaproteobacteria bacterium]